MNQRDFKKKEYIYPDNMKSWINRVVQLDSLNNELKQFTETYRGWNMIIFANKSKICKKLEFGFFVKKFVKLKKDLHFLARM